MHLEEGAAPEACTAHTDTLSQDEALKAASTAGAPTPPSFFFFFIFFWSPGESRLPRSGIQSPGGAFNLKGVLTLFTQNSSNMQRSSKSIVVKQRGGLAALAACPPRARLALATRRHHRPPQPRRWQPCPPYPPLASLHSCQIYLEQEVST